jgi:pimeloyl-ACP methyl ester carboxylesterase
MLPGPVLPSVRSATAAALCLITAAVLAVDQGTPSDQYRFEKRPDGTQYRTTRNLEDPAVPARAVEVVRFIESLGYTPRFAPSLGFAWRWRSSRARPDSFEFDLGQFHATSATPREPNHGLNVTIRPGIEDPGYEVLPAHGGSNALVDGSSFPKAEGIYSEKFVSLSPNSGIWLGRGLLTQPRANLTCGAVSVQASGNPLVGLKLSPEEVNARLWEFYTPIVEHLKGVEAKLRAAGLCHGSASAPPVELLDANPSYFKVENGKKLFDYTDPKAARFFLDNQDRNRGAQQFAINAREKRKGAAADGVSLLILRSEVPSTGGAVFTLPGGARDGSLYRITDGAVAGPGGSEVQVGTFEAEDAGRVRHWALALYRPPDSFGAGGGERVAKVELAFTSAARTESKGTGEIRLIRPPVVLVHGTFDDPVSCWATKSIPEAETTMKDRLEAEGFRVFLTDWHDTNGQRDPSSFLYNARAVWQRRGGIKEALASVRREQFAVTQADVVTHSQGGVITRMYARGRWGEDTLKDDDYHFTSRRDCAETCEFHRPDNFTAGDIHRLITISTTHYGSDICRLFDAFKYFEDNKRLVADPVLGKGWDGLRTEFVLMLHPSREGELIGEAPAGSSEPAPGRSKLSAIASELYEAFWKKLDWLRNYSFTQGFRDQVPGSDGLRRLMRTPIPSHAIACVADDQAMLTLNKGFYQERLELMWTVSPATLLEAAFKRMGQDSDAEDLARRKQAEDVLIGRADLLRSQLARQPNQPTRQEQLFELERRIADSQRLNAARLRSAVFGNTPNDCTVRQDSAIGGLSDRGGVSVMYHTVISGVLHGPAPQFPAVQQRVVELLKNNGTLFAPEGFPAAGVLPPALPYDGPGPPATSDDLYAPAATPAPPSTPPAPTTPPRVFREAEPAKPVTAEPKPRADPKERAEAIPPGPAVVAPDGTLRLELVGSEMRKQGDQIVVTRAESPSPGAPNFLKTGAVLVAVFSLEDGREVPATELSVDALARILNTDTAPTMVVLRFRLPDGESVDVPHPGRLPPKKD